LTISLVRFEGKWVWDVVVYDFTLGKISLKFLFKNLFTVLLQQIMHFFFEREVGALALKKAIFSVIGYWVDRVACLQKHLDRVYGLLLCFVSLGRISTWLHH
jgi:hypothetical protein